MTDPQTVISSWIERLVANGHAISEKQISMRLQPKPVWLPQWTWNKIIARVVVLEERQI